jgi:hypothetical protein
MWHQVTVPFGRLLGEHLYPALFPNADYQKFLAGAGVQPPYPATVSGLGAPQQNALSQNAQMRAHLLGLELEGLKALEHAHAKAVEVAGPLHLYRLYNSEVPKSEFRFFWFTEDLLRESFQKAGGKKKDRLEWLRGQLAVAYNWSACDKIARLNLKRGDAILGVEAVGLPIRKIQIGQTDSSVKLPKDYWKNHDNYSSLFPGGAPQLFLFLLPDRVEPYW